MGARTSNRALFSALIQTQHLLQGLKITGAIRKIPFAQSAYAYLYQHWVPHDKLAVEAFGSRLLLDPNDMGMSRTLILKAGEWERAETRVVCSLVREGMTLVDIGANMGYYSLLAASLVGSSGRVFSFEPSPRNFSFLESSVAANGYRNITLTRKAVSNSSGTAQFEIDPASSGNHRISRLGAKPNSILVETISLDDYFEAVPGAIDFVKLDAEGAEPFILEGMHRLIERNPNLVLMTEFSPVAMRAFGRSPESFLSELRNCGFAIYTISDAGRSGVALDSKSDSVFVAQSPSANLLCLRGDTATSGRGCES
jgi:FkbM family methyltransferase